MYQINDTIRIRQYPMYIFKVCAVADGITTNNYDIQIVECVPGDSGMRSNIGVHLLVDIEQKGEVIEILGRARAAPLKEVKVHRRFRYSTI